jgi:hypothetical protein
MGKRTRVTRAERAKPGTLKLSRNTIQQRIEFNEVLIQVHWRTVITLLALFPVSTHAIPRLIQFCRSF